MKNVKNKKMMAVVLPEGCFYGNCSDCVYGRLRTKTSLRLPDSMGIARFSR